MSSTWMTLERDTGEERPKDIYQGAEYQRACRPRKMSPMLWLLGAGLLCGARADVAIMKDVTLGFGQALERCREESQLTEDKMEQFFEFWHEDFKLELREMGCALHCMSRYYGLLTGSGRMHHDNTHRFISSFPNGEALSQQLVQLIHSCEQEHDSEPDQCWRILRVADCFRSACRRTGLAPSAELAMAELIMDSERA